MVSVSAACEVGAVSALYSIVVVVAREYRRMEGLGLALIVVGGG